MKLDKKGITLVEIVVSLALISTVLIFLMGLFINVRGTYVSSKAMADYDMLVATFVKSVGDDIKNYGLLSVEYKEGSEFASEVVFTFNAYRPTKLSQRIKKVLKIYMDVTGQYHMSYAYDADVSDNIVSAERTTNVVREIPKDGIIDAVENIHIRQLETKAVEVRVPITTSTGADYTINIYGIIEENKDKENDRAV